MRDERKVLENQILVFSVNLSTLYGSDNPSQAQFPVNLRFAADAMVVKAIAYQTSTANPPGVDLDQMVQIWCNITNDNIIGAFTNNGLGLYHNDCFTISNTIQNSSILFQFQQVVPNGTTPIASYGTGPLISDTPTAQRTFGTVSITIEFLRHSKD